MINKLLLAAIAAGLWANAIATFVHPGYAADTAPTVTTPTKVDTAAQPTKADTDLYLPKIEHHLSAIAADIHSLLTGGKECENSKICD
jgi:hypothetical protein